MEQQLDRRSREHARSNGDPGTPGDLAAPLRCARFAEEGHQRPHDENRLEPLAQQQQERLAQETCPGAAISDEPLRAFQPREHAAACQRDLRFRRAPPPPPPPRRHPGA